MVSPAFCDIIDDLSPAKDYPLYVADYRYGDMILDRGIFQIYNSNSELVPLAHSSIVSQVQDELCYTRTAPMGLVLQNSIETFFSSDILNLPSSFYCSGDMVALWRVLEGECSYQEGSLWSVSSGARTICMLPKITDNQGLKRLKRKYSLAGNCSNVTHWELFSKIAKHRDFPEPWNSRLIFFPKQWLQHREDPAWSRFYYYLLNKAWNDSTFKRKISIKSLLSDSNTSLDWLVEPETSDPVDYYELGVLAGLLKSEGLDVIKATIRSENFSNHYYRKIFESFMAQVDKDGHTDILALLDQRLVSINTINAMRENYHSYASIEACARAMKEASKQRQLQGLIGHAQRVLKTRQQGEKLDEVFNQLQSGIDKLALNAVSSVGSWREVSGDAWPRLGDIESAGTSAGLMNVSWGLPIVDSYLAGIYGHRLINFITNQLSYYLSCYPEPIEQALDSYCHDYLMNPEGDILCS